MTTQEAQAELEELLPATEKAISEFTSLTASRDHRLAELREQSIAACNEYRDIIAAAVHRMQPMIDRRRDLESFLRMTK